MKKEREQKTEQSEETAILDENMARLTLLSEIALPKDSDMGKVYASDPNANAKLKKMFKDKTWNAKKVNVKLIHGNKTAKSRILIEYGDRSKVWIGPATDTSKNIGGWTKVASRRQ